MESISPAKAQAQSQRSLASLKIVSRLLSHELHAQSVSKTLTLSRDAVVEIQTVVDVFIEESSRRQGLPSGTAGTVSAEPVLTVARN
jgi:hypothetical protein